MAEDLAIDHQYEEANRLLAELSGELPGVSKLLITRARALAWSKQYQKAVNLYEKIHRMNPSDPVPLKEGARAAAWGKDMDTAWNLYEKVLKPPVARQLAQALDSTAYAPLPPELAIIAKQIKEDPKGEDIFRPYEDFSRALAKDKIPAWQKNRLETLLLDLRPAYLTQKAAYLEALAKLAQWNKRHTQALSAYEKLVAFQPGNQEALFDLAQTQCALGLCDEEGPNLQEAFGTGPPALPGGPGAQETGHT